MNKPTIAYEDTWPIDGMVAWANETSIQLAGRELHDHEVIRATPWSTVVRWDLDGTLIWGKAVCPGFAVECSLLPLLAEHTPDRVVAPLSTEPQHGWLLLPDGGSTLHGTADVQAWHRALLGYAEIQHVFSGASKALLEAGCPDMRPHAAVERLEQLMEHGHVPEHRWLIDAARSTASQIDSELIPATIQHDDLRPDNVFADGRVFDWGDASLGHPFASLLTGLMPNRPGTPEQKSVIRDAYLTTWRHPETDAAASLDQLRHQADLAVMLAPIARIDTWLRAPTAALRAYPDAIERWVQHLLTTDWR